MITFFWRHKRLITPIKTYLKIFFSRWIRELCKICVSQEYVAIRRQCSTRELSQPQFTGGIQPARAVGGGSFSVRLLFLLIYTVCAYYRSTQCMPITCVHFFLPCWEDRTPHWKSHNVLLYILFQHWFIIVGGVVITQYWVCTVFFYKYVCSHVYLSTARKLSSQLEQCFLLICNIVLPK